jgi:hypothetical protein
MAMIAKHIETNYAKGCVGYNSSFFFFHDGVSCQFIKVPTDMKVGSQ